MKSIKQEVVFETTINKSVFINHLVNVSSAEDVDNCLAHLREIHPSANHHCYAYLIGDHHEIQKYSDDGEPNRTAGFPMMEVLKKHDLTNILTVSIRYFGGIKLGAGGLVRAYTKSVAGAIEQAVFTTKQLYHILHVSIPFDMIGSVEKYLRDNVSLLDTTYTEQVTYQIKVHASQCDEIITTLTNNTKGSVKIENIHQVEEYE